MKKVKGKRHGKDHGGTGKAKVATVTRKATAVSIIKSGPVSREQWAKEADKLYVKCGGSSNIRESEWAVWHTLGVLKALEMVAVKEDGTIAFHPKN